MKYQFKGKVYDETDVEDLMQDVCLCNSCYRPCPMISPIDGSCMSSIYLAAVVNGEDATYINPLKEQIIYHLICQDIIDVVEE